MPNVLEIRAKDLGTENLKGTFDIQVIGHSFSSYDL